MLGTVVTMVGLIVIGLTLAGIGSPEARTAWATLPTGLLLISFSTRSLSAASRPLTTKSRCPRPGPDLGQLSCPQLIDRSQLACRPIRDVLLAYLEERRPGLDYNSLQHLAFSLGALFWKDLERHHPGIDSLRLQPEAAAPGSNGSGPRPAP